MKKIIITAALALALGGVTVSRDGAQALPIAPEGLRPPAAGLADIEKIQFIYRGRRYCWYYDAWYGPGWYWCGYAWRRGFGWGGPVGWRGWRYPGWRHRPPPRRPGINRPRPDRPGVDRPRPNRPGVNRPGGNRPGVNRPGGNRPGVNRPGGNRPGVNRPGGNRPGVNRPGGNRPGVNRPGGNRPGGGRGGNRQRSGHLLPTDTIVVVLAGRYPTTLAVLPPVFTV